MFLLHLFHIKSNYTGASNMDSDILDVTLLIRQFLCCTPIHKLNLSTSSRDKNVQIDTEMQKQILDNTVNNRLVKQYPIKTSYQRAFLKLLMNKLEENGNEIHEDMYNTYCKLVSLPDNKSTHYRHFLMERKDTLDCVTVQESTNIISQGTTGLCSWQGALALSEWCTKNKHKLSGKTILELGCGVGSTGLIVATTCSPKRYIFSDCHESVLELLCENIMLNLLSSEEITHTETQKPYEELKLRTKYKDTTIDVLKLKWEEIHEYINTENKHLPDIIIGADILYESSSFPALISGIKSLFNAHSSYAVIAATIRNTDTVLHFLNQLGNHNINYEELPVPKQTISIEVTDVPVRIFKIFQ